MNLLKYTRILAVLSVSLFSQVVCADENDEEVYVSDSISVMNNVNSYTYDSLMTFAGKLERRRTVHTPYNGDLIRLTERDISLMNNIITRYLPVNSETNNMMDYILNILSCYYNDENPIKCNLCKKEYEKKLKLTKSKKMAFRIGLKTNYPPIWRDFLGGSYYVEYDYELRNEDLSSEDLKLFKIKGNAYTLKIKSRARVTARPSYTSYSLPYEFVWLFKDEMAASNFKLQEYDQLECKVQNVDIDNQKILCVNKIGG